MGLLDSLGGSLRNVAAAAAPVLIAEAARGELPTIPVDERVAEVRAIKTG